MSKLKSIFVTSLITYSFVVWVYSIILFLSGSAEGIGLFLSNLLILIYFGALFLKPRARTSKGLHIYTLLIIISTVADFYFNKNLIHHLLILFTVLGWLVYVYWYSSLGNRTSNNLISGELLPHFNVKNLEGDTLQIPTYFTNKPLLILFYRANWCPLCMAQIKEVADKYKEIAKLGTEVLLISPQPEKFTQELAQKFSVPFNFLVDKENKAAKQLGIFHSSGTPFGLQVLGYKSDTVMPTVVITDSEGKIIFSDLTDNYRIRPEPEIFLDILSKNRSLKAV